MAYSVNRAVVLGNMGRDPDVRYTQSGKAVTNFTVATNERRGGEDVTEWHNVVVWDKLAELCGELLAKGCKVYVEGRLQTREYNDKDGNRRWSTEIVAREMVFLTTKRGLEGNQGRHRAAPDHYTGGGMKNSRGGYGSGDQRAAADDARRQDGGYTQGYGGGDGEDIPF